MKQVKFRPSISKHDFDVKLNTIKKFLTKGHNVRITIMFRGREIIRQDNGVELLNKIEKEVQQLAAMQRLNGLKQRHMIAVLQVRKR